MPPDTTQPSTAKRKTSAKTSGVRARGGQARTPKKGETRAPAAKRAPAKRPARVTRDGPLWERAFITALANTGNVRAACQAARVGRSTVYDRRGASDVFVDAWDAALQEAADVLAAEALRRAVHGTQEPIYYKGEVVGHVFRYSDVLLIFLLKAARPEKYRERYEHTGKDGGPIEFDAKAVLASRLDAIASRSGTPDDPGVAEQRRG